MDTKAVDINLMKKDCQENKPGNGCIQTSYEYNGLTNALCGEMNFEVKRFYVIQMDDTKVQYQEDK